MANRKSAEERKQELLEKKNKIEAQLQKIEAQQKEAERKARTRRLINIGAAVEHYAGEITDLEAFNRYLAQYGNAIASTQKKAQETTNAATPTNENSVNAHTYGGALHG